MSRGIKLLFFVNIISTLFLAGLITMGNLSIVTPVVEYEHVDTIPNEPLAISEDEAIASPSASVVSESTNEPAFTPEELIESQ